jgi:hypothetical protein
MKGIQRHSIMRKGVISSDKSDKHVSAGHGANLQGGIHDIISDTEKLKRKIQKLSAVFEFYEDLDERKEKNQRNQRDTLQKIEFARKQMMKLCMEGKQIIKEAEHKEMV